MVLANNFQTNRYRSVAYKFNRQTSFSTQLNSINKNNLCLSTTAKHSKIRQRKHPSSYSLLNQTDIKRARTENNEQSLQGLPHRKQSYLDTFHFLLKMEKNRFNKVEKEKAATHIKNQLRVQLPSLNQSSSQFTVLDNINLPINYIREGIHKLQTQLKNDNLQLKGIKASIKEIGNAQQKQIEQIKAIGRKGIKKLEDLLRVNRIVHQQASLSYKNSFEKCVGYLPAFLETLQKNKQKTLQLQVTIFKGQPFELQQDLESTQFNTTYF